MKTLKKITDLLTERERNKSIFLFLAIIFTSLLDVLGIASIFPFISILSNPELIKTNNLLAYLYQIAGALGVTSIENFIFILGMLTFLILITSLTVRAITLYVQVNFALMLEYSIGKRLVENYLHQPYAWFLNKNSSELRKNILSEVNLITYNTLLPIINIFSQSVLVVTLLILIIFIDPLLAFSAGLILVLLYLIIFLSVKNFLSRIGLENSKTDLQRFSSLSNAFGSVKEMKVLGLEKFYISLFAEPAKSFANKQILLQVTSQLPRFFLEGIAFGGMIIIILILLVRYENFANTLPALALYAFAGYRLIPALQQIYNAITQLRFSGTSLNIVHGDLTNLKSFKKKKDSKPMSIIKSIMLKDVCYSYPNNIRTTLDSINISIPAYKKIGIVGSTGCGKTTTVDIILGLLKPQKGNLIIDGNIISDANKTSWQKNIGYVPQQIYLADASIAENIALGVNVNNIDHNSLERAAKIANIHEYIINDLPQSYNTNVGERGLRLSGGQRQRIGIARALYHNPKVLILDEATNSLDNNTEKNIMESISNLKNKITIILISHRMNTVKDCDIIFLLNKGKLTAQGSYNELKKLNKI